MPGAKKSYKYACLRYTQNADRPNLVTFNAAASDISDWAGVPSKSEKFHGGFQRALGKRYKQIIDFFEDEQNTSPTAVVIAFRTGTASIAELPYPSNWPEDRKYHNKIKFGEIEFEVEEVDEKDADVFDLAQRVAVLLEPRFVGEAPDSAENSDSEDYETNDDGLGDEEEIQSNDNGDQTEQEDDDDTYGLYSTSYDSSLDIGNSRLREFYDFLCDRESIRQWLEEQENKKSKIVARKKAKKRLSKTEKEFIEIAPEIRLKRVLISLLRPAMIVDGQHRVMGAAEATTEKELEFTVCAIPDADWVEQVFQFVIINKLAKPISSGFLTSILNTSLKNSEIEEITPRLESVNIDLADSRLMKEIQHVENSPFYQMVAQPGLMAAGDAIGKLSDKGMLRIARFWYNMASGNTGKPEWVKCFREGVPGSRVPDKIRWWRENGGWAKYFFAFWWAIRELYEDEGIWVSQQGFHLLMIVTMMSIQELYITTKARAQIALATPEELHDDAKKWFNQVPAAFFVGWEGKGLQSGDGPDHIKEALTAVIDGESLNKAKAKYYIFTRK